MKQLSLFIASPYLIMPFIFLTIILAILFFKLYKKSIKISLLLSHQKWQSFLVKNFSLKKKKIQLSLRFLGIISIMFALTRLQYDQKIRTVKQEGHNILIALDISRSMLAQDIKPNRLTVAQEKIKDLLELLPCERIGLLLFASSAFVHCPLTSDIESFKQFLNQVDMDTMSAGTTAIETVIEKSLDTFKNIPNIANKILIIMTDGEDYSRNLKESKKRAQEQQIKIFTLGIGTLHGAPIPQYNNEHKITGHVTDEKGNIVISKLNNGILQSLAHDLGGIYLPVTKDKSDIQAIYSWVQKFEKEHFEDKKISQYTDLYPLFGIISFICFLLEWLL